MILTYLVLFLIAWTVAGFAFTLLLWPLIVRILEKQNRPPNNTGA